MDFYYENAGINTYLVYRVKSEDVIDTMSLGMLTNNKINGLATTVFTQMDEDKFIKYNVSAKVSVKQFFTGPVNKARLLGVFNGIVNAMLAAEDYMIAPESIILNTEYIFSDVSTCDTILICLPLQTANQMQDLGVFFKNIMFNTQFDQTENCDYVARIINHLNSVPSFSLAEFKTVLDSLTQLNTVTSMPQKSSAVEKTQTAATSTAKPQLKVQEPLPSQQQRQAVLSVTPVPSQLPNIAPNASNNKQTSGQMPVGNQFAVPSSAQKAPATASQQPPEKKISMFDLLMHYNSENAAAYKAQKAAKKQNGKVGDDPQAATQKMHKSGKAAPTSGVGFAIPGQAPAVQPITPSQSPAASQTATPVTPVAPVKPAPITTQTTQKPVTPIPVAPQNDTPSSSGQQQIPSSSGLNFGETTVLGGGGTGETTVLRTGAAQAKQISPRLIREKNNEIILINKPVFRIGKEKSYVDYFISDNTAISRSHANIIIRDDKCYIVDTNSTNHTFVNGQMIPSSTEIEITHGMKLRFANENFEFQMF